MDQQKALEFLEGLRDTELCLFDFENRRRSVRRSKLARQNISAGYLSEVVRRKPHSLISKQVGLIESINWQPQTTRSGDNMYIFKLESVALQDENFIIKGKAMAYDMHDDTVSDTPIEVELVVDEVTEATQNSWLVCL